MSKSEQVSGFLGGWIVTNVHASGYMAEGDLAAAAVLADKCVALAAAQSISRSDMEAAVGDLKEHMRKALNVAQKASEQTGKDDHPSRTS